MKINRTYIRSDDNANENFVYSVVLRDNTRGIMIPYPTAWFLLTVNSL